MNKTKPVLLIVGLFLFALHGFALKPKKQLQAVKTSSDIRIDGKLDEAVWSTVPVATGFKTYQPTIGEQAYQKSEVRVVYDNRAIYFGAFEF